MDNQNRCMQNGCSIYTDLDNKFVVGFRKLLKTLKPEVFVEALIKK